MNDLHSEQARLDHFLDLKDNWDSYGAKPLQKETIEQAKICLQRIYEAELDSYLIFTGPTCSGAINFEFQSGSRWAALSIKPNIFALSFSDQDENFNPNILQEIIARLVTFFKP